jgi:hypothetical protein
VIRDFSSARPRSVKQIALVSTHPRSKYRAPMVRSNSLNLSTPFSLFQPAFGVLLWTRRERRGKRLARPLLENCLEAEVFRRFFSCQAYSGVSCRRKRDRARTSRKSDAPFAVPVNHCGAFFNGGKRGSPSCRIVRRFIYSGWSGLAIVRHM